MPIVYVREQGAELRVKNGRLIVFADRTTQTVQADVPLNQVEQIVVFGSANLTPALIAHCLREGVDVCYLSQRGNYKGRLAGDLSKSARLRQEQFRRCAEPGFALGIARAMIEGKIHNQMAFLQRRRGQGAVDGEALDQMAALRRRAGVASGLETLLGIEGAASRLYFNLLAELLPEMTGFAGTRERPARDPINAMLNMGYTLLYREVMGVLHLVGFDPYLGCLHQPSHGHAALASDLVEEFRSVTVDSLVVALVNRREMKADDFSYTPGGMTRFEEEALKRFIERYDARLETQTHYVPRQARFTYRQIIELQARHLAQVFRGDCATYQPMHWDY